MDCEDIMNRLIYLFELDSVRKYPNVKNGVAFTPGIKSLFREIIAYGNSVAITMNQLTDSQLIKEAIEDDLAYSCLLQLFECGAVRVSLYNDVRTASQYFQQAIQKQLSEQGDSFVFSNLPVKQNEKGVLEKIQTALRFSDLSLLQEQVQHAEGIAKERWNYIYRFVNMILQISVCETSNIPRKDEAKRSFEEFLDVMLSVLEQNNFEDNVLQEQIHHAIGVIKERGMQISSGRNNRSNWLKWEANSFSERFANELIHICYNYTVEDSILGVSKGYDDFEFETTFWGDLVERVREAYVELQNETVHEMKIVSKTEWKRIVRFAEYQMRNKSDNLERLYVRNDDRGEDRQKWLYYMFVQTLESLGMALIYILIFFAVEIGISYMENAFSSPLKNTFVSSVLSVLLLGIFSSIISRLLKVLNHKQDMPDILESLVQIGVHFCDFIRVIGGRYDE